MKRCEEDTNFLTSLGEIITQYRKDKGFSREGVAARGGISRTSSYGLSRGEKDIQVLSLRYTAKCLDTSLAEIFYDADKESNVGMKRRIALDIARGDLTIDELRDVLLGTDFEKENMLKFANELISIALKR